MWSTPETQSLMVLTANSQPFFFFSVKEARCYLFHTDFSKVSLEDTEAINRGFGFCFTEILQLDLPLHFLPLIFKHLSCVQESL